MTDVAINELMDDAAVDALRVRYDVRYDPHLVDDRGALIGLVRHARALIVRNGGWVDLPLLEVGISGCPSIDTAGRKVEAVRRHWPRKCNSPASRASGRCGEVSSRSCGWRCRVAAEVCPVVTS